MEQVRPPVGRVSAYVRDAEAGRVRGEVVRHLLRLPLGLDPRELKRRLSGRSAAIKLLLLDQRIVAGLGNIYVCEALFRAGIHPARAGGSVSMPRVAKLVGAIEAVLAEAIAAGGSSLSDFASPAGELGYFSKSFAVYDREGQPCVCGGNVRRIVQGGRSTFYCPRCQH